jgi:hypothetical protein
MAVSGDETGAAQAASTGVTFEVERFAWADGNRLEVAGRWYGIRGRRFLRPTLDVEVDGNPRRMLALLEHKPWAADDGEEWFAAFEWTGDPVELVTAELAVGPELAVELPSPSGAPARKARRVRPAGERLEGRPPRAQALEADLVAAQAEIKDLRERVAAEQRARERRVEQVDALREESAAAQAAAEAERDEAGVARDAATAARDKVLSERDDLVAARDAAVAERDAAVAARDAALAEAARAASDREKAVRERTVVERELAAAAKARDKARAERNEWMTRARAAAAPREGRRAPRAGDAAAPSPADAAAPEGAETAGKGAVSTDRPPGTPRGKRAARSAPGERAAGTAPADRAAGAAPTEGAADAPPARRPRLRRGAAQPGGRPAGKPRKASIPPGGILLPPTGPGSHMRRSVLPGWAPRLLVPIALVILVVVVALLIAWAF